MAGFERCPPEVVESITSYLDVMNAGNLRLTNRCLRSKATQGHFKSFFRSKRVNITGLDLRNLGTLTQRGWLGCETLDLALVGVVNNTKRLEAAVEANPDDPRKRGLEILQERQRDYQQLLDSGQIVHLIREVFKNILANSPTGKLRSLSLEVVVYREDAKHELPPVSGGSWRLIWQTAAETFQIVFSALQESKMEIGSLNIFNGPQLHRCSIAGNELSDMNYSAEGLSTSLGSLRWLSISVSDRILDITPQNAQASGDSADEIDWSDDEDRDLDDVMDEAEDESNFTGLSGLIHACQNLKGLEVHQYLVNHRRLDPPIDVPHERLFQRVAELESLPLLEECSFRGVVLRETDLLAFLKEVSISLRSLSMETVTMTSGTFESIFGYVASDVSELESLYFDDLMIGRDLVHFTDVGEPRFHAWVGARGSNTLRRQGEEVKKPILYHLPTGVPLPISSPERQRWLQDQRREYGPP
ncbi:F-box domain protein [Aspergillus cavernicola]|uniref:F-box domain protein n=1 Tax=Aspergillus cavernicola TaxID=176166 RepID=A0ABR4ILJ0_9EURO